MKWRLPRWWEIGFIGFLAAEVTVVAYTLPFNPVLALPLMMISILAIIVLVFRGQIVEAWPTSVAFGVLGLAASLWTALN